MYRSWLRQGAVAALALGLIEMFVSLQQQLRKVGRHPGGKPYADRDAALSHDAAPVMVANQLAAIFKQLPGGALFIHGSDQDKLLASVAAQQAGRGGERNLLQKCGQAAQHLVSCSVGEFVVE